MEFKNTIIKSVTALLCVIALCITAVSSTGKYFDAKVDAAKNAGSASASGDDIDNSGDIDANVDVTVPEEDVPGDASGDANEDPAADPSDSDASTPDASTPDSSNSNKPTDSKNNNSSKPSSNSSKPSAPKTAAEIVAYYNQATAKAVKSKVGYNKTRVTDHENMDAPAVLRAFKDLVYKFMGIGADNKYTETVTKGKWGDVNYLAASKLSTADVTSASCKTSGNNYVITMKLKNGSSSAGKSNPTTAPNAALDKTGICVGTKDKGYFDHKTASVIYSAIEGTYAGAEVKESYSNATVKATINASTGNIVSLTVEWNCSVTISKILGASADATGISHVNYTGFKY